MKVTNVYRLKLMKKCLIVFTTLLFLLFIRVGFLQLVQGAELTNKAFEQQILNRNVNPKRGTIYDSTKNVLAMSATVETVSVTPTNIAKEDKEKVANAFVEIFNDLDYDKVLKKINKNTSIEIIVKRVDKDKTDKLREWMKDNNILSGINIDEDTKRYYPYNNLASHVIGFCGSDNQGLDGLEAKYDNLLKGEIGRISRITDAKGKEIDDEPEEYKKPVNGKDLVLTIDLTIQSIAEKYLKQACIDNKCTDGGNIIIMDPKTGDVLAMTTYPDYNLNLPYEINLEELKLNWSNMSNQERNKSLQQMWRNKAIADTYEPGSTFKLVTTSAALEEGITSTDKEGEFCCTGSIEIAGVRIKCWRYYRPHGSQSLRNALMNSCNPVFIGLGQKIGIHKYYDYLSKFGLLSRTGIDLNGEANSIFLKESKVGPVELATISFGQRFEITPMQLVTVVSTIANGGIQMQPRLVKQIIDSETGEITNIEPVAKSEVISKKTADGVLSMMQSVVEEGTGKNAKVQGYTIGGKTGTSEDGVNTNKYVTSFVGVSPIENPQIAMLITLYNPTGEGGHQGGAVAAPIASQVLGEVLPYLEVKKTNNIEEQPEIKKVAMPDIKGLTIKEAKELLKQMELSIQTEEMDDNSIIEEQIPKPGIEINSGTKVYVNVNENDMF